MLYIPFFFLNTGKQWGNAASPNTERLKTGCLADLSLKVTDAPTGTCSMKQKMKFDSHLSFQTAELRDDLPVWLVSMLNSSFQLHSASGIQWWESYRNWTGRAVPSVNWCSEHQQFKVNWFVFFYKKLTHPELKEHPESNTIKVELNKQWKANNYAAIMGICS